MNIYIYNLNDNVDMYLFLPAKDWDPGAKYEDLKAARNNFVFDLRDEFINEKYIIVIKETKLNPHHNQLLINYPLW